MSRESRKSIGNNLNLSERKELENQLVLFLQSKNKFKDLVTNELIKSSEQGFNTYNDLEYYKFHATSCPTKDIEKWEHNHLLITSPTYRRWFGELARGKKSLVKAFNGKELLMSEWMMSLHESDQVVWERTPHLIRVDNPAMREKRGDIKSRRCYVGNNLARVALNHSYAADRRKYYSYQNHRYGRVKYIWVFKHSYVMDTFMQVDNANHSHLGFSKYGCAIDGIIKIEFGESHFLHEATWTWEKQL